jgi:serine/threonine-protein kinase
MGVPTIPAPRAAIGVEPSGLRPGALVAERYRLVERRGIGAMGSVWSARHVELGTAVAIKFLHPDVVASEEARTRFAREARLAAVLGERSRYIVRVTDYGLVDDIGPYLVMELLSGEELGERIKREGRLPLDETVAIVSQVCRALEVAHDAGVVHRDVKPANVFLAHPHTNMRVFAKLMDFGVAKLVDPPPRGGGLATRIGTLVGTPAYMSPEQLIGDPIDHRADLWAVGALVYRMLTGEFPFGTGTLHELGMRIVGSAPRSARALVSGLPDGIDQWFARALAKSKEERFATARELSHTLCAVAGIDADAVVPYALPHAGPGSDPSPSGFRISAALPVVPEPSTVVGERPFALARHVSGYRKVRRWPRLILPFSITAAAIGGLVATATGVFAPGSVSVLESDPLPPIDPVPSADPAKQAASVAPPPSPGKAKGRPTKSGRP